jgi:hypothetical protein
MRPGAAANCGQDRQANRDAEQDPIVEPARSPLRARTGADQLRSPELVCTLPAREDSAADHPKAQPCHSRRSLEMPSLQQHLKQVGGDVIAPERRSPEYLAQFLVAEIKKWEGPIKASGVSF